VSTTATLSYTVTAVGPTVPATLETALAAVQLDLNAIETMTGCTLASDTTGLSGSVATRTIVFNINTGAFEANFPAGTDQTAPFNSLYDGAISLALDCPCHANPVVIA
jgi:hypothetical protein